MGANQQERRGLLKEHQVAVNWSEQLFFPRGAEAGIPGVPAGRAWGESWGGDLRAREA